MTGTDRSSESADASRETTSTGPSPTEPRLGRQRADAPTIPERYASFASVELLVLYDRENTDAWVTADRLTLGEAMPDG